MEEGNLGTKGDPGLCGAPTRSSNRQCSDPTSASQELLEQRSGSQPLGSPSGRVAGVSEVWVWLCLGPGWVPVVERCRASSEAARGG